MAWRAFTRPQAKSQSFPTPSLWSENCAARACRAHVVGRHGSDAICLVADGVATSARFTYSHLLRRSSCPRFRNKAFSLLKLTYIMRTYNAPVYAPLPRTVRGNADVKSSMRNTESVRGWIITQSGPSSHKSVPKVPTHLRPPKAPRLLPVAASVMPLADSAAYPLHQHTTRQAL